MTTTTVSTKPNAGADAIETNLTINWGGMSPEEVQALAQQALIVKWQAQQRKSGSIPADATVNATDYKVGARAPRKTLEEQVASMGDADKAALIAKLQAMLAK